MMSYAIAQRYLPQSGTTTTLPPADSDDVGAKLLPSPKVYILVIASWMLGNAVYKFVMAKISRRAATALAPMCALAVVVIEGLEAMGVLSNSYMVVCLLAPIFAIGTAASARGGLSVVTNAATGHLQSLAFDAVELMLCTPGRVQVIKRMFLSMSMVGCFVLGGATSTYVADRLGVGGGTGKANLFLLTPAGLMLSILMVLNDLYFVPLERGVRSYLKELVEMTPLSRDPQARHVVEMAIESLDHPTGSLFETASFHDREKGLSFYCD